ncbi:MAG TPA: glycosyltransferase family 87 protein [Anaeromyxobacteraceae bacterium]
MPSLARIAAEPARPAPPTRWARLRAAVDARASWIPAIFVLAALADEIVSRSRVGPDFAVFHRAAARFVAGEPLYRLSDGHFCFKYAPAAAALLSPLAALPARAAEIAFNAASAVALLAFMRFAAGGPRAARGALASTAATLYAMPLYTMLFFLGQSDALLLAAVVGSELSAERRPSLSGALWAVAIVFKPPMVLLAAVAVGFRQWRRLGWGVGWTVALLAASALRYGVAGGLHELAAWRTLLAGTTAPLLCDPQNQSVLAVACSFVATPERPGAFRAAVALLGGGVAAAMAASVWSVARRDRELARRLAFMGALYLAAFLSPLGWRVNLLAALPLLHVALGLVRGASRRWLRVASLAAVALWIGVGNTMSDRILGPRAVEALMLGRFWALGALAIALLATCGTALEARATPVDRPPKQPGSRR